MDQGAARAFAASERRPRLSDGWHIDANYTSALSPPAGIRMHALFGDVMPRAGGTLIVSGSHGWSTTTSKIIRRHRAPVAPNTEGCSNVILISVTYTPREMRPSAPLASSIAPRA